MVWEVDHDRRFNDISELCEYLFDPESYDDTDSVNEYIDECYDRVEIAGHVFMPSEILWECNNDLWYEIQDDWRNLQSENDTNEYGPQLESMEAGEGDYYNGFYVECINEDEEDDDGCYEEAEEDNEVDEEEEIIIKTLMEHFQMIK